jgi:hypothetical protein
VTSDGGLLLVRELDERLGFGELIQRNLTDGRGKNTQLSLTDLVPHSIYSRLAGYEDVNDAERLSQDRAFRLIGSEKVLERGAALTSRLQSFKTELLTQAENLAGLAALNRELVAKGEAIDSRRRVVLDMDSTELAVYVRQCRQDNLFWTLHDGDAPDCPLLRAGQLRRPKRAVTIAAGGCLVG